MHMVKRKVISFFAILASFVALLMVLHYLRFGSLTGLTVSDGYNNPNTIINNDFEFDFNKYWIDNDYLMASYSLIELAGKNQQIEVNYVLQENGEDFVIGEQDIVLEKGNRDDYLLKIKLPPHSDRLNLALRLSNGNSDVEFEKEILTPESRIKTTGFAVFENKDNLSLLGLLLISLMFLFLIIKLFNRRKTFNKNERKFEKNLIKLDFE